MQNLKSRIQNFEKGFTLIELLIVIAIIGVLSTLLMANFVGVRQRARDSQRKSDLRQIQAALEIYRSDNGAYPDSSASEFPATCGKTDSILTLNGTVYMQKVPCDPNGARYTYTGSGTSYTLVTCLENVNDSQKDAANDSTYCAGGTTNWSYTTSNP